MCFSYTFCPHFNAEIKMEITSVRFIFGLLGGNRLQQSRLFVPLEGIF